MHNSKKKPFFIVLSLFMTIILTACSGTRPEQLSSDQTTLLPCPDSPNCVNSRSNNQVHSIKPLRFKQPMSQTAAVTAVKEALLSLPRVELITETPSYLYAEATSKVMRFVDDVEFLFPNEDMIQEVQLRSASRLGYKDFDVNRLRIEKIRAILIEEGLAVRE